MCEAAGYPTSSLTCEGFLRQAAATAIGLGMPNLPVALVPGHIGAQSDAEIRRNILEVTAQHVIDNLTIMPAARGEQSEPGPRDIVVKGGFREVNRYFYEHEFSDGLPIVPPTRAEIESFLRFTERDPDEILGVLLPDRACDTDGIDGTENNAGAIAAPDSFARAAKHGLRADQLLDNNDGYGYFSALGDLVVTGPTRTNVNDYRAILVTA